MNDNVESDPTMQAENVRIYGLPKGTVLWPTAITAMILGVLAQFIPSWAPQLSIAFLVIFTLNLLILFFEFSRGAVLGLGGLFFGLIILYLWLKDKYGFSIGGTDRFEHGLQGASGDFLIVFGAILLIMIILGWFVKRYFDYYIITRNEVIRKHGILGDTERFSAQNMVYQKEIPDVFESLLLFGSGTLTIIPSGAHTLFRLDNVPRINKVEEILSHLLSKLEVDVNGNRF